MADKFKDHTGSFEDAVRRSLSDRGPAPELVSAIEHGLNLPPIPSAHTTPAEAAELSALRIRNLAAAPASGINTNPELDEEQRSPLPPLLESAVPSDSKVAGRFIEALGAAFLGVGVDVAVKESFVHAAFPFTVGTVLVLCGLNWSRIKKILPEQFSSRAAVIAADPKWWVAVFLLLFVYVGGSVLIDRMQPPLASPAMALSSQQIESWSQILSQHGKRTVTINYNLNSAEASRKTIIEVLKAGNKWELARVPIGMTLKDQGSIIRLRTDDPAANDLRLFMYLFDRSTNVYPTDDMKPGEVLIWLKEPWKDPNAE